MMIKPGDRQNGFALVLVLIVLAVATVLGMGYLYSASVQRASCDNLIAATRAKYLAESGLQHAIYVLQTDLAAMENSSATAPRGPFYADGSNDQYVFYCQTYPGSPGLYLLSSRATVGGVTQKSSVTVKRAPAAKVTSPYPMLAGNTLYLPFTLTVNGSVYANGGLANYAHINGSAWAAGSIADPYGWITGTKTPNAPTRALPRFVWGDYASYTFYRTNYAAAVTPLLTDFKSDDPLAGGKAVTEGNPGGVVVLKPSDGQNVKLKDNLYFRGTLVIDGNLYIDGTNITLEAVDGFPAVVASGKILTRTDKSATIKGLVKAEGGIVPDGSADRAVTAINGGLIAAANGYYITLKGTHTLTHVSDRCTVYDFKCRDALPAVELLTWND